jgi:hypothetical protein
VRDRLRTDATWWAAALAGVLTMSWLALTGFAWNDYDNEVSAAYGALSAGDIHGFLALAPAYGGSLVLRAPFAGITAALGGGELAVYRAVSIPCIFAVAVLAVALVRRMRARGHSTGARALALGLCVANPITLRALEIGHPEELLGAAFAIGAVLAAADRRTILAAVLLGLAIATKAWAVLAIGPVLLALPGRRILALGIAGLIPLAVIAPIWLTGSPETFVVSSATTGGTIFQPWHLFWFLGDTGQVVIGGNGLPKPDGWRVPPGWLSPLTHPFIAFLVVPLSLAWARVHRGASRPHPEQLLALLALLFFLRCALDPWNVIYYQLPFVLALLTWEVLCRPERPPVAALTVTVLTWVTFQSAPNWLSPDMQSVVFVAWALPLIAWLARAVFTTSAARPERRSSAAAQPQPIAA